MSIRKSLVAVVLLVVGLDVAALLTYWKLDNLVNADLYSYGLRFDLVWAEGYWSSYRRGLFSVLFSILLAVGNLLIHDDSGRQEDSIFELLGVLLGVSPAVLGLVSLYYVSQVDAIVHGTLYQYGLRFSWEWAGTYWTIVRSFMMLIGLASAFSIPLTFIGWRKIKEERRQLIKVTCESEGPRKTRVSVY